MAKKQDFKPVIIPADCGMDHPKSSRREMPIDVEIGERRLSPRDSHEDADKDYYGGLDKFREYATKNSTGLKPNRDGYK